MKLYISAILLLLNTTFLKSQDLRSIKTTSDCLKFITTNIEGEQNFYFDTIFSTSQLRDLKLPFKNWGILDFNGDQKPDLYYIGRTKKDWTHWASAYLYLSQGKTYKKIPLLRKHDGQYSPLVYSQKLQNTQLLFVYLFDLNNNTKIDSLMQRRLNLYPSGIRVVDTLVYKYHSIINYSRQPSNLTFDSLTYKVNYGQTCRNDSFTVYKNGTVKYAYVWCGSVEFEKLLTIDPMKLDTLKKLVKEININITDRDYFVFATDLSTAKLKLFNGGNEITVRDYGMESTFTLRAIYNFFASLEPNKIE